MSTSTQTVSPLQGLFRFGQSVWLDYIRRSLITSGELQRLINEDGLRGVTSNPAIFEKAIAGSTDYQDIITSPDSRNLDAKSLYEKIAIGDVQAAADLLRPVYDQSKARDGYVSLEVSPFLARDTAGTLEEARRLWKTVNRPNLMIKVPATSEGIPAIRTLISEGINVNVTLLFSQAAYEKVADAYLAGLEQLAANGGDLSRVGSVASFFISRIDTAVDALIEARFRASKDRGEQSLLDSLLGRAAISNAKVTYQRYRELFGAGSKRWAKLAALGAQSQRVLWASTSSKNPRYRDVIYVEELIGQDTVNTIPPATFDAFRDHGKLRPSVTEDVAGAFDLLDALERAGVSMDAVTAKLLDDGLKQFVDAFERLLAATGRPIENPNCARINSLSYSLPKSIETAVQSTLERWTKDGMVRRLWQGDATLWTGKDESDWLGWLHIADEQTAQLDQLTNLAHEVKEAGYAFVVLLGMGGSSLCPEVMSKTFGKVAGFPELLVLDSTDPAQIRSLQHKIDLTKTLFIVSSKSGSTPEPNLFKQYFFEQVKQLLGAEEAGRRFIAVTDPNSKLQQIAEGDHFRHIFYGLPSIGGRYSALSHFGMVPAAAMGVDLSRFLANTEEMVQACGPTVAAEQNPGVVLGAILGAAANQGRDKVTLIASPGIADLGAWLEQLLAESTGKNGKGLIPIDREQIGEPSVYGGDRVFAYLRLESAPDAGQDRAVEAIEKSGQPVIRIRVQDIYSIGEEFFRWEIATAVAGSVMGINPFDQPDVEASKIATRKLTAEYEQKGQLSAELPLFKGDGVTLFTDEANAAALRENGAGDSLESFLKAHLSRLRAGDYFALLGYIEMNAEHESMLQAIRHAVRDQRGVATCLGFGPRFLHSTGQAYKGGPNSGVFLQITCDDAADLQVPGQKYTFGVVKAAQARGDLQVLSERGRRVLRVHLGPDLEAGLHEIASTIQKALQ